MRMSLLALIATGIVLGCTNPALAGEANTGPLDDGCIKFENSDIGVENISKTADGVTVTLFDWVQKDGESGEYVGVSYRIEGGEGSVSIKSGTNVDAALSSPWVNPNGLSGRNAKAISNIVFCPTDGGGPAPPASFGFMDEGSEPIARSTRWGALKLNFK
ncbi:MAG: hypothetical protein HKN21_03575 [Candidatus Eisenbacteria bacterium]|uniref:Lipoprotein n=1 Tax=Eiseniibacteriota bacterium TaxID=2212470 RepID=A0A7Y2E6Y5_UNCEI|nr:hypothetical protein [Candidatus Eisenbacteria bacterium]